MRAETLALGAAAGHAIVRVTENTFVAALDVEAGAIHQTLGGRLYAQVVRADGTPAANVPVVFEGPRISTVRATTDAEGYARGEVSLSPLSEQDRCGGASATSITLRAGIRPNAFERTQCIAVDHESATRVRAPARVQVGEPISIEILRAPSVRRAPVHLTALAITSDRTAVLASVRTEGDRAELTLPAGAPRVVTLRARPVVEGREVKGA